MLSRRQITSALILALYTSTSIAAGVPLPTQQTRIIRPGGMAYTPWINAQSSSTNSSVEKTAIWLDSAAEGQRFEFVSEGQCQAIEFDESPLYVSDFFSQHGENAFEALRSTGQFKKDGSNILGKLPRGSLVQVLENSSKQYQEIQVLSVARFDSLTKESVVKTGQKAFIYKESLDELANYGFVFENPTQLAQMKAMGLDLEGRTLVAELSDKLKLKGLNCCTGQNCEAFILFEVIENGNALNHLKVAVSAKKPSLFEGAVAVSPDAEGEGEGEDAGEESQESQQESKDPVSGESEAPSASDPMIVASTAPVTSEAQTSSGATNTTSEVKTEIAGIPVTQGNHESVICAEGEVRIRDVKSGATQFTARLGEKVKIVQAFDQSAKQDIIKSGSKTYHLLTAQFPERKGVVGKVAQEFIQHPAQCELLKKLGDKIEEGIREDRPPKSEANRSSLTFPTIGRPILSYLSGMRAFGSRRKKGKRVHAACDLYRSDGEKVRSVDQGRRIRGMFYYYEGTCAFDIQTKAGFVARYGEVKCGGYGSGNQFDSKGGISKGGIVARMGTVHSCRSKKSGCGPMLHFEIYRGSTNLPLAPKRNYRRPPGLVNPTPYLRQWEAATFGKSY